MLFAAKQNSSTCTTVMEADTRLEFIEMKEFYARKRIIKAPEQHEDSFRLLVNGTESSYLVSNTFICSLKIRLLKFRLFCLSTGYQMCVRSHESDLHPSSHFQSACLIGLYLKKAQLFIFYLLQIWTSIFLYSASGTLL